eukprot:scaffold5_cov169-Amphora_coffeaeformis.AAC.25
MNTVAPRRIALVMGVANHRSIAWACVQEFLAHNTDCIVTYHPRFQMHVDRLVDSFSQQEEKHQEGGKILGQFSCEVETGIPELFHAQIPDLLGDGRRLDTVLHSIAFADMEHTKSLGQASWSAYAQAQQISSYSLIETARCAFALSGSEGKHPVMADHSSLTALSYLGAVRALPPYHIMGPAKASLEANVRGLAAEYGCVKDEYATNTNRTLRVNAVSAGPVATLSSRGIPNFGDWSRQVADTSPLKRNVTTQEIASTVHFLSKASGITGQTIYVDAGYSSVIPVHG